MASDNPTRLHLKGLKGIGLWSLKQPKLYQLSCVLLKDGQEIDRYALRMGFRDIRFTAEGFFLNGERIQLTGLNRHQAYPYVGYAMPGRVQRRDADILKDELGLNCVRTSHYPQSRHFLDRCDEIGLMVFEEIPGWQHVGDEAWQQQVLLDVEQMIISHRNHPSIFLWGVRVNESQDHHELYTRSNARARALDPTRPTGGARFIPNSELLEDVAAEWHAIMCAKNPAAYCIAVIRQRAVEAGKRWMAEREARESEQELDEDAIAEEEP